MSFKDNLLNATATLSDISPKVKIIVGVVGLIGAAVYACVKSMKVKEATEEEREIFDDIHRVRQSQDGTLPEEEKIPDDITECYSNRDYAKDVIRASFEFGKKVVKYYAIPLGVGLVSTLLIFNGMNVLNTRNAALSASLASLSACFQEYRERVKDRFGQEVEDELYYAVEYKEVENKETGAVEKKAVVNIGDHPLSDYLIVFNQECSEWVNDINYCEHTLRGFESVLQHELDSGRAYITFENLCHKLGKDISEKSERYQLMGMLTGWRHGDKIDFRIKRVSIPVKGGDRYVEYCTIDPNVRDIHRELVDKYNGNENGAV